MFKYLKTSFSFAFLLVMCANLMAQTAYRDQEFSIATENDAYLLKNNDHYYSNGILIYYRFVPTPGSFFNKQPSDSVKSIVEFSLIQKYFTPTNLGLTDPIDFDRPYAGLLTTGVKVTKFPKPDRAYSYGVELGVIGRASGAEALQEWYHSWAGFPDPKGWGFQIRNELIAAIKFEYNRQFSLLPRTIDLVTDSRVQMGTAFLNTNQGLDLRFGKLRPLNNSAFKNSLIGKGSSRFEGHNYFFIGTGVEYVVHNTTIQGSIWNDRSPHTEEIFNWIWHWRLGWAANSENATFKMTYYHLTKEVIGAQNHAYLGFELFLRFRPSKKRSYTKPSD